MNWFFWVLLGYFVVGGLASVLLIGEPRKPIEPGVAAATVVINALLILGTWHYLT